MADGVWNGVYPNVIRRSEQLSLNRFFDWITPSRRTGHDGDEKMMEIVTDVGASLPPNGDRLQRDRLCQYNQHQNNIKLGYVKC